MDHELVLLTGATGFLGYQVLVTALKAGYRVRCAVRTPQGIQRILDSPDIRKLGQASRHLSWVIVPSITDHSAYDEAVRDVHYIIHVASPVKTAPGEATEEDEEETLVKPAIAGVMGMLASAASQSSTVRRIVVTSSVVATLPTHLFGTETPSDTTPFNPDHRLPSQSPPYTPGMAYIASKIASLNAAETWMRDHQPSFDMISLLPAWIWGRNGLATSVDMLNKGSNAVLLRILEGKGSQYPINSAVVSVNAAAKAHVLALSPTIKGNQAFFAGQLENLEEVNRIAEREFPEAVANKLFSKQSEQATVSIPMNIEPSKTVLGLELDSLQSMVLEVATQFFDLKQPGSAGN